MFITRAGGGKGEGDGGKLNVYCGSLGVSSLLCGSLGTSPWGALSGDFSFSSGGSSAREGSRFSSMGFRGSGVESGW